jgi:hypothetical protein
VNDDEDEGDVPRDARVLRGLRDREFLDGVVVELDVSATVLLRLLSRLAGADHSDSVVTLSVSKSSMELPGPVPVLVLAEPADTDEDPVELRSFSLSVKSMKMRLRACW